MLQSLLFFANQALERAASNSPPLARGSRGDAVRSLQFALHALGHSMPRSVTSRSLSADGVFGSETDQTVRAFQRQQRLTVDGVAGAQTLGRLDQLLIQTGRDPLMVAFTDLRRLGASLVRAATAG
jgi:peptidoglycan hydrolase-like protein with peptidoglycan-binding domain